MYVYIIVVFVALVALLISSTNYAELYNGIDKFRVVIDDFNCSIDEISGIINIEMNMTFIHNSSFSGFSLHSMIFELRYNSTSTPLLKTTVWFNREGVAPFSNITKEYDTDIYIQNDPVAQEFQDFSQQSEDISWTFSSLLRLYIFGGDSPGEITPPSFSFSTKSPV